MRRSLLLLGLLLLLWPIAAAAQDSAPVDRLTVSMWPEYDRAAMLVIYQVSLSPELEIPAEIALPVPTSAGSPHAVANAHADGSLVNASFTTEEAGEWIIVTVQAESRRVWLEYYDELTYGSEGREFTFRWPATIGVQEFSYEVQRPPGATDLELEPDTTGQRADAQGLTYLTGSLGPVPAGEPFDVSLRYDRTTERLTAELLEDPPALPEAETEPAPDSSIPLWSLGAGGFIILALAAGGYYLWQRQASPSRPRRRSPGAKEARNEAETRFCQECGEQVGVKDRFCRRCGTELRSPN